MRPEIIEYLFDYYLTQKQNPQSYDAVDGVFYSPQFVVRLQSSFNAGDPGISIDDRRNEIPVIQGAVLHQPYHAPLSVEQRNLVENFGRQLSNMSDDFEMEQMGHRSILAEEDSSIFQFEKQCIFVSPTAEKCVITIVRTGNSEELSVPWQTKDDSAVAGVHYVSSSGILHFQRGETQKRVEIELLSDHKDNLITFKVELIDNEPINVGRKNYLSVNISDCEKLPRDEKSIVRRIMECKYPSIAHVTTYLSENITTNTLKTALLCLCGNAVSLKHEFLVAFSLAEFALQSDRRDHVLNVLCKYFQGAPELETLVSEEIEDESSNSEDEELD